MDLCFNKYASYIYNLDNVFFVNSLDKSMDVKFSFTEKNLNFDYFTSNNSLNFYKIPMSMHPDTYLFLEHYKKGLTKGKKRLNSIFFSGNSNKKSYSKISKDAKFSIINRYDFIQKMKNHEKLDVRAFNKYEVQPSNVIVYNDSESNRLPKRLFIDQLHNFKYFLCLPGVVMPFSHNLIEAMKCGCIPVIQNSYAELMNPPLEHMETALIFNSFEEFVNIFEFIQNYSDSAGKVDSISDNVLRYYSKYLEINVVISNILNQLNEEGEFSLMASHNSVNLISSC